ncbi:MAG: YHS domain-containing protein [Methanosarcina sp.]|nr:YHS domain-containing protein [Methanosarcina sp.]
MYLGIGDKIEISWRIFNYRGIIIIVVDPVCKMKLDEKEARFKSEYKGKTYYFCALSDKKMFDENPEKYIES